MSTALLFALCALLVFFPLVAELIRLAHRMIGNLSKRRERPAPRAFPRDDLEAPIRQRLYSNVPRWRRLEAVPRARLAPERAQRRLRGVGAPQTPARRVGARSSPLGGEPSAAGAASPGKRHSRAA